VPLGQLEAFTPPPTTKLIVPVGFTSWWGVDPSTLRVALAMIDAECRHSVVTASFDRRLPTIDRLPEVRARTLALASAAAEVARPGVIAVEKPAGFGKRPNPELAYAVGVIMCALGEAVPVATLVLVEGSKWKRVACGDGAIAKPKRPDEPYAVLTWARTLGYRGTSWDEADACGVAEWARRTYRLEQR
jgi:hypothetical protein